MDRLDISFSSAGTECRAWLYRPPTEAPTPLVVMAHGFSATREQRLDAYAERFRAAGVGALLFDYRHFGASEGQPRQLLDIGRQRADYHAAIAYARRVDWVDSERVALFGSSFSGGHVLAVGAQDGRIAAIVAQCPFTDGRATLLALRPADAVRATVAGLRDQIGAWTGRSPHYIPAVGPPGPFAVMNSPDAEPGFAALTPAESLWENRVAARVALRIGLDRPGRLASRLTCPVLFCVCDNDVITPPDPTLRYAATAPQGEVKHYPVGHFAIYVGDVWEQAVADQTEFLTRVLGVTGVSAPVAVDVS